jgi:hypothetical protein
MADTPHPSSIAGGPYDGVTFPYIPKATRVRLALPAIGRRLAAEPFSSL